MCVIVVKQRGSDFCPKETIRQCFDANPHGFAFAWNEGGALRVFKTVDKEEAMNRYKELSTTLDPAETAMIVHARWKTHGSVDVKNCHCFVHGDVAFAHNGVLDIESKNDMTDSEIFFRELFAPVMDQLGMDFALKMARMFIGRTNNKFALIDKDGHLWFTSGAQGFTKKKFDGYRGVIYFSNLHWQPRNTFSDVVGGDPYEGIRKQQKASAPQPHQRAAGSSPKGGALLSLSALRTQVARPEPLAIHGRLPFSATEADYERRYSQLTGR